MEHEVVEDERGFFTEVYRADQFAAHARLGLPSTFVQLNHSRSVQRVTRGLHFQWDPPMGKLMRVVRGEAFLVAVDIRPDSATLGQYESIIASEWNRLQLWAPAGFARGFLSSGCRGSRVLDDRDLQPDGRVRRALGRCKDRHRPAGSRAHPCSQGCRGPVTRRVAGAAGGASLPHRKRASVRIFIAGGAGYIGTVLAPRLAARGYAVTVADLAWFGNKLPPEPRASARTSWPSPRRISSGPT